MVADKFTTNLLIKIKHQKRERERASLRSVFFFHPSLSLSRKKIRPVNSRTVKWCSAAQRGMCSANDRRPFKSRRLKSFSTRGSGKHRHGFSSTFQTPAAPPRPRRRRRRSLARYVPAPLFSFHARSLPHALAYITNEHRAVPRNLYGRYSRRFHYFQLRCPVVRILRTRWITCSTRRKTGTVIKRRPSCRSNCRRDSSRNEPAGYRERSFRDWLRLPILCVYVWGIYQESFVARHAARNPGLRATRYY